MFYSQAIWECGWCGRVEGEFGVRLPTDDNCIAQCREYRRDMEMLGRATPDLVRQVRTKSAVYVVGS